MHNQGTLVQKVKFISIVILWNDQKQKEIHNLFYTVLE